MDPNNPTFWNILLLSSPCLIGIAIFGHLYWSGERDYKKKERDNKQNQ